MPQPSARALNDNCLNVCAWPLRRPWNSLARQRNEAGSRRCSVMLQLDLCVVVALAIPAMRLRRSTIEARRRAALTLLQFPPWTPFNSAPPRRICWWSRLRWWWWSVRKAQSTKSGREECKMARLVPSRGPRIAVRERCGYRTTTKVWIKTELRINWKIRLLICANRKIATARANVLMLLTHTVGQYVAPLA